ncbi:MAG: HAMP domain-containing protein [Bacteroidetes bacterium]|jgi:two-component system, NtrC family, sensor kinase|nr:HAMP domain-containing protein [Bacteroidota bacterium]MBT3747721.1 HAMP domain-containing protein [Bacteroidota bacterium]MBT4399638.1 HAMP domain-containing protein [Bacteroidota bacterium]MBT4409728.1 HAMP domain-containing protein [Bacteroidota bacterium]MBT7093936.1 HAMP domain-containing protein [Bacteroidota bacterium]
MESNIQQSGNNVGLLVEGALYQHMLENDKTAINNTLQIINTMPGILDVNMYDHADNLVYSSFPVDTNLQNNPNCKECHTNIDIMFPGKEKTFRIINMDSKCNMSLKNYDNRVLLIRAPILNEPSCYTSACHAHKETDEVLGSFVIRIPLEELDKNLKKSVLLAIFTTLILMSFLMIFTRRKIKKPLNAILAASEAVSKGDIRSRLEIKPNQLSDVRVVSSAFNEMLDNLQLATNELQNWSQQLEYKVQKKSEEISEMQNELIHVERIASLGKLSSSVAHEINNPLSGVLTYTKLVQKKLRRHMSDNPAKESMLEYLKVIEIETKRCGDIVKGLLEFSIKDQQDFEELNLHIILEKAYSLLAHQMKMLNISFQADFSAKSDLIFCSENQIKQACIAILLNASEAVIENGDIMMRTSNPGKDTIKLEIIDNGQGISPEDIPHIFEPFFSAKQKVSGTGLGLAIVHGIVQSHKGKVDVESTLGESTIISLTLPLVKN